MSTHFLKYYPNPTPRLSALTGHERSFARKYPHFVRFFEHVEDDIWLYVREKNDETISFVPLIQDIPELNEFLARITTKPIPLPQRKEFAAQIMARSTAQRPCMGHDGERIFSIIELYIGAKYPTFFHYFAFDPSSGDWPMWCDIPFSVIAELDRTLWERDREPIMKVLRHLPLPIAWAVREELFIEL
jgi:hypothetical protein